MFYVVLIMSQSEDSTNEDIEDLADTAKRLQKALHDVPAQAKLVSKLTRQQADKLAREVQRIRPPPRVAKQIRAPQLPTKMPQPKIPKTNTAFTAFAGKRRKIKDAMSILTGR
jgi:hypothetical protein